MCKKQISVSRCKFTHWDLVIEVFHSVPNRTDGPKREPRRNPSHQEEDSEDSDTPEAETWYYKGESVAQINQAWRQPLAHGATSSVDKESPKDTDVTGTTTSQHRRTHRTIWKPSSPWSEKSMENNLAIPWKI